MVFVSWPIIESNLFILLLRSSGLKNADDFSYHPLLSLAEPLENFKNNK